MRVMPFVQVLLLLLLLSYLLFVALENPGVVHLPLPFGRGEYIAPIGTTITAFLLAGGVYSSILFLPVLIQKHTQYLNERREKKATQQRLAQSLQARLGAAPRTNHLIAEELIETPTPPTIPIIEYTMPPAPAIQAPPEPPITETDPPEPKVNLEKPHDRSQSNIELLAQPEPEPVKVDLTRPDDYKRISDDVARSLEEYIWQEETQATKKEMEEILIQTKMAVALSNFDSKCEYFGFASTQYDRKYLEAAFNTDKPDIQSFAQASSKQQTQEKISDSKPLITSQQKEHAPQSKPEQTKVNLARPISLKRPPRNKKTAKQIQSQTTPIPSSATQMETVKTQDIQTASTPQTTTPTNLDPDQQDTIHPQLTASHHTTDLTAHSDLKQASASIHHQQTEHDTEFGFEEFSFDLDQFSFTLDQFTEHDTFISDPLDHQQKEKMTIRPEQSESEPPKEDAKKPEAQPETQEEKTETVIEKASKHTKFSIKKNKEKIKSATSQSKQKLSLVKKAPTSQKVILQKPQTKPQVDLSKPTKQPTDAKLLKKTPTDDVSADLALASQESEPPMPQEPQPSVQSTKDHLKATEQ